MIYNYESWILKSPDIIQTLNRIIKQYYTSRCKQLPENNSIKQVNDGCVLIFCRHKGQYIKIANLDYKMFYPSIVYGLKLNPSSDYLGAYQYILNYLLDALNKIPKDNREDAKKIKGFITKMCSGWLNSKDFVFMDSKMHRKVLSYGKKIMEKVVNITDKNSDFKLLTVNTDGMYVQCLQNKNIQKYFNDLAFEINKTINIPFLTIRIKNIWTEIDIFNVNSYFVYNKYSQDYDFKGFEDWLYNFKIKWRDENGNSMQYE
tara:strand:+ start:815 stop:1594 length:780 start_codon:yes stop_codon:yes gene_type:complete